MFDQSFEDKWREFKTGSACEAVEGHDGGWPVGSKKDEGMDGGF